MRPDISVAGRKTVILREVDRCEDAAAGPGWTHQDVILFLFLLFQDAAYSLLYCLVGKSVLDSGA